MTLECSECEGNGCSECLNTGYSETHAQYIACLGSEIEHMIVIGQKTELRETVDALEALADFARHSWDAFTCRKNGRMGSAADFQKRAENAYAKIKTLEMAW